MYNNCFTIANPGLIVFMVDQSYSMNNLWFDDRSLAEVAAWTINNCLEEMIMHLDDRVRERTNVVFIGYGGIENSDKAYVISSTTINKIVESPLKVEEVKQKISDGAGGLLEVEAIIPTWIEPKVNVKNNVEGAMAAAFKLVYQLVDGWVEKRKCSVTSDFSNCYCSNPQNDPVPLIINITAGSLEDEEQWNVRKYASDIKNIRCYDGHPLILNICYSCHETEELIYPSVSDIILSKDCPLFLFDISSEIPEIFRKNMFQDFYCWERQNHFFILNCKDLSFVITDMPLLRDPDNIFFSESFFED